ncbi:hypothetical protein ABH909_000112 [Pseudomonas sp. BS3782 TE3695]
MTHSHGPTVFHCDHHFPPTEKKPTKRKGQFFSVCPGVNTESLLANASEDLLSISAIAADLADHVQGSSRSVPWHSAAWPMACICWWIKRWIIWMDRKWRQ